MKEELSVLDILKLRYSLPRIHWLIGTISIICCLYLSSEEIWVITDSMPFPEIAIEGLIFYIIFFTTGALLLNYFDIKKIGQSFSLTLIMSMISLLIDIFLISFAEFIVLSTIQVLPQDILSMFIVLVVGALPSSMGSIALSSLTAETLKQRSQKLSKEVQELAKQVPQLKKLLKDSEERLKLLELRKKEFEEALDK